MGLLGRGLNVVSSDVLLILEDAVDWCEPKAHAGLAQSHLALLAHSSPVLIIKEVFLLAREAGVLPGA